MVMNKTWKKAAAFAMALALMGGVIGAAGTTSSMIKASAADEEVITTYTVTLTCNEEGGSVLVDKTSAQAKDTVTVTAIPNADYVTSKVTLNGDQIAVNDMGVYAFEMPAQDSVVNVEFVKQDTDFYSIEGISNGAVLVEVIDLENKILKITPEPAEGYVLGKVTLNGDQVAINDQGEYMVQSTGEKMVISAEFVKAEIFTVADDIKNGKVTAEVINEGTGTAVKVTPVADEGYKLAKVTCNGDQVAVNDKNEYVIAYMDKTLNISAEFVKAEAAEADIYKIADVKNGKLTAEIIKEGDSIAVKVTPVADKGFKLAKVTCNGDQVAVNDKNEYLIAYMGKTLNISAEFAAEASKTDSSPKTGAAAAGLSIAGLAVAAAALCFRKKQ